MKRIWCQHTNLDSEITIQLLTRYIVSLTSLKKHLKIKVCSAVFADIAQAFDRVWHNGLLHKLRSTLPDHYYRLLESYLTNRHFHVKHENSYSELKFIKADVPQGSVLGPVLYLFYINDLPTTLYSTTAMFADDSSHGSRRV
jgi:hypothetical protein